MILQALHQLAEREALLPDPDFEWKPVAWLVRVGDGGRLLGLTGTHFTPEVEEGSKKKPKPRAKSFEVPREDSRTSGDRSFFLFDKAEYVFGLDPDDKRPPAKLANRFALFREKVDACLESTADPGVRAVAALLARIETGDEEITLPEGCATNDLFAFVYAPDEDLLVHQRPAVRKYWKTLRAAAGGDGAGDTVRCLVSGEPCVPVGKHPQLKNVPGGSTSGIALVSFNSNAFESYGWSGNDNAPISRDASEAFSTSLNRLLHPAFPDPNHPGATLPRRNIRLSGDTTVCYWAVGGGEGLAASFSGLMDGNPEEVGELYRGLFRGREVALADPGRFYALTLTGTQGRAILREWIEASVQDAADHLAAHFRDLRIARRTPRPKERDLPPALPLRALTRSLAFQGDEARVPAHLAGQIIVAALSGGPYPLSLLQRAIERTRAEIGNTSWADLERFDARVALIKGVLNRRLPRGLNHQPYPEITETMDPTQTQDGYLLGRLMAVIELMQQTALGDINATVVDRFFGAASATPATVFPRLLRGFRHHVRKARDGNDEQAKKRAGWLSSVADQIIAGLQGEARDAVNAWIRFGSREVPTLPPSAFPPFLPLEEQGLFILGYHHQRHYFFMRKDERAAWEAEHGPAAVDDSLSTLPSENQ